MWAPSNDNRAVSTAKLELSLLDTMVIWNGTSAAQVFKESLDMAIYAEQLGFKRYWLSENHNSAYHAGSAPELLIAQLAAYTSRISVGTSNLLLPHQSPLKVVENFRTMAGIFPQRIDLGFALSLGNDLMVAQALHRTHELMNKEEFPEHLADLLAYLSDSYATSRGKIIASPQISTKLDVWIEGSNHESAQYATDYGLGLVMEHHTSRAISTEVLRAYRKFFKPSVLREKAHSIWIVPVFCAETDEEAERLAKPLDLWEVRKKQGSDLPPPSSREANEHSFTSYEEEIKISIRSGSFVGSAARVGSELRQLAEEAAVDELMILTIHPDIKARKRSIELLSKEFQTQTNPFEGVNYDV
ncbi:MsnO8 family LLM class oxidoreductase [Paenibacillus eucommiae]|uniref:Luciferase family oxidoreductase group 1 n=1 Tax=Paenibacillus eucommiae TaxID=1355755 RepID=A0ABS4J904_9BACL|nr:MsnO8 family LLM class oxidoreductase [Paenibacillus eucommiae]MBP1996324.1 luciferase family oxidoreductase group 1 [Paenibacillus eucommiae]